MILKKNITGFSDHSDTQTKTDPKHIKSTVYSLEATKVHKIIEFNDPGQSSNYFKIIIADLRTNDNVGVLINGHYPYYCGVTSGTSWMNHKFIELPSTIRNYLDKKFEFLTPAELNSIVNSSDLKELSDSELRQINYWKSKTFGEIIFNGYD